MHTLCDPMCGSGTIPIEAALIATRTAPGLLRAPPPLLRWRHVDDEPYAQAWREAVSEAEETRIDYLPNPILGADVHAGALELARAGAAAAGVESHITFVKSHVSDLDPAVHVDGSADLVVSNPPWDLRLGEYLGPDTPDAAESWASRGRFLRSRCAGGEAWLLSGNSDLTRHLRLRASSRLPLKQAANSLRFLRYEMLPPRTEAERDGRGRGQDGRAGRGARRRPERAVATRAPRGEPAPSSADRSAARFTRDVGSPFAPSTSSPAPARAAGDGAQPVFADGTGMTSDELESVFRGMYDDD